MKEIVITLLILVSNNEIQNKNITIFQSCYTWYRDNVMKNKKRKKLFSNKSYYEFNHLKVVGYVCNDKEPV